MSSKCSAINFERIPKNRKLRRIILADESVRNKCYDLNLKNPDKIAEWHRLAKETE